MKPGDSAAEVTACIAAYAKDGDALDAWLGKFPGLAQNLIAPLPMGDMVAAACAATAFVADAKSAATSTEVRTKAFGYLESDVLAGQILMTKLLDQDDMT